MAMKFHTLNGNRCRRSHRAEHRSVSGKASLHHLSRCNILEVGLANRKSYFNEHAGWNPSSRESDCPLPAVDSGPSLPCNNRVPTWVRREAANPRRSFRQRLDFSSWAQRPCNHSTRACVPAAQEPAWSPLRHAPASRPAWVHLAGTGDQVPPRPETPIERENSGGAGDGAAAGDPAPPPPRASQCVSARAHIRAHI